MHSPQLINDILELKLSLDLCEPSKTASVQKEIESKLDAICLISKVPKQRAEDVVNSRYREFVQERFKTGKLTAKLTQIKIPQPPPPET